MWPSTCLVCPGRSEVGAPLTPGVTTRPLACRSLLFVPGDRPERFDKACASGADAVILDLEDAVLAVHKPAARNHVQAWLQAREPAGGPLVLVRVNSPAAGQEVHPQELALVALPAAHGLMLPKAEGAALLQALHRALPAKALWPILETAAGVWTAADVAGAPGVAGLVFGSVDLMLDLGISDEAALAAYRAQVVLVSRLAGLPAPIDGISRQFADDAALAGLAAQCALARRQGWGGKLCIHPRQVAAVHQGWWPDEAELAQARRIVQAADAAGNGAWSLDGAMVDAPVVAAARCLLARAAP